MQLEKKMAALISLITAAPKGEFFSFENGTLQTYDGKAIRGNLYLDGRPALNYSITEPKNISILFATGSPPRIAYEPFIFSGSDSVEEIAKVAKAYAIASQIVAYFDKLLEYAEKGGKLYVATQ